MLRGTAMTTFDGMKRKDRTSAAIRAMLLFGFAMILVGVQSLAHTGMARAMQGPTLAMSHVTDADGAMTHGTGRHGTMNDALCAMICAGITTFEGAAFPTRLRVLSPARWRVEASLVWVPPTPDPALKPPDLLRLT